MLFTSPLRLLHLRHLSTLLVNGTHRNPFWETKGVDFLFVFLAWIKYPSNTLLIHSSIHGPGIYSWTVFIYDTFTIYVKNNIYTSVILNLSRFKRVSMRWSSPSRSWLWYRKEKFRPKKHKVYMTFSPFMVWFIVPTLGLYLYVVTNILKTQFHLNFLVVRLGEG